MEPTDRAVELAYKRRGRHSARVRTPGGVAKYGQAIGQIIRRDVLDRLWRRPGPVTEAAAGDLSSHRVDTSNEKHHGFYEDWQSTQTPFGDYIRFMNDGVRLRVAPTEDEGVWVWHAENAAAGGEAKSRSGRTKGRARAQQLAEWAGQEIVKERGYSVFPLERLNRDTDPPYVRKDNTVVRDFGDVVLGIEYNPYRNIYRSFARVKSTGATDYLLAEHTAPSLAEQAHAVDELTESYRHNPKLFEDARRRRKHDTWQQYSDGVRGVGWSRKGDPPRTDMKSRKQLARIESQELDVKVDDSMPVAYHELANMLLRAYEAMFPGFTRLLSKGVTFSPETDNPRAKAWAQNLSPNEMPDAVVNFVRTYWNKNRRELIDDAENDLSAESKWHVGRPESKPKGDYSILDHLFISSMHHELGHVVHQTFIWDQDFTEELYAELERLGIVRPISDALGLHEFSLPVSRILVSEYGASSLNELLAEIWSEYMQDPHPREAVARIGAMMQQALEKYLDTHGK